MSFTKRLLDIARSNLTDFRTAFVRDEDRELLDKSAPAPAPAEDAKSESTDGEAQSDDESVGAKAGRKARKVKDVAEDAWDRAYEAARARAGVRGDPPSDPSADRKKWYRTLELEPGAELPAVRKAYRRLMRTYHPDRFVNDPEKLRAATEMARRLTEAYNGLSRYLGA
jgi:DnaJ-domain-containing protein 1